MAEQEEDIKKVVLSRAEQRKQEETENALNKAPMLPSEGEEEKKSGMTAVEKRLFILRWTALLIGLGMIMLIGRIYMLAEEKRSQQQQDQQTDKADPWAYIDDKPVQPFRFRTKYNAVPGLSYTSEIKDLKGFTGKIPIVLESEDENASLVINGVDTGLKKVFATPGKIGVRTRVPDEYNTLHTLTVDANGYRTSWSIKTAPQPVPLEDNFKPITNAGRDQLYWSQTVAFTDLQHPQLLTVTSNQEVRILRNGADTEDTEFLVTRGDRVQIGVQTPTGYSETVTVDITVGEKKTLWTINTQDSPNLARIDEFLLKTMSFNGPGYKKAIEILNDGILADDPDFKFWSGNPAGSSGVGYVFKQPVSVSRIVIDQSVAVLYNPQTHALEMSGSPADELKISASNNGLQWQLIHYEKNLTSGIIEIKIPDQDKKFSYWRVMSASTLTGDGWQLAEIGMYD